MSETTIAAAPDLEYRFNIHPAWHNCAACGSRFQTRAGSWPYAAGTDAPLCGEPGCTAGKDVTGPSPCTTRFVFAPLHEATLRAIEAAHDAAVAERLRQVSLDETLPDEDRSLLQRAAIDLQFCEAGSTHIRSTSPRLVLQTCGEAAAEMLLSGCGEPA